MNLYEFECLETCAQSVCKSIGVRLESRLLLAHRTQRLLQLSTACFTVSHTRTQLLLLHNKHHSTLITPVTNYQLQQLITPVTNYQLITPVTSSQCSCIDMSTRRMWSECSHYDTFLIPFLSTPFFSKSILASIISALFSVHLSTFYLFCIILKTFDLRTLKHLLSKNPENTFTLGKLITLANGKGPSVYGQF